MEIGFDLDSINRLISVSDKKPHISSIGQLIGKDVESEVWEIVEDSSKKVRVAFRTFYNAERDRVTEMKNRKHRQCSHFYGLKDQLNNSDTGKEGVRPKYHVYHLSFLFSSLYSYS